MDRTGRNENAEIDPATLESIKNDDPSCINESFLDVNFPSYKHLLTSIIKYDAIKCMMKLHQFNERALYTYQNDSVVISPKMGHLLFDIYGMHLYEMGYFLPVSMLVKFKEHAGLKIKNALYLNSLLLAIQQNDMEGITYILDNVSSFTDMNGILQTRATEMSPEVFMLLLSKGFHYGPPVIPSIFIEQNRIDQINTLINDYHFILDFGALGVESISNMIRNNAYEFTKMMIEYNAVDNYIPVIINGCALYNCEEMLDMVLSTAKRKLKPGAANKALISAAKIGRANIFKKLLIPTAVDMKAVGEARQAAEDNGYDEIVRIVDEELPVDIANPPPTNNNTYRGKPMDDESLDIEETSADFGKIFDSEDDMGYHRGFSNQSSFRGFGQDNVPESPLGFSARMAASNIYQPDALDNLDDELEIAPPESPLGFGQNPGGFAFRQMPDLPMPGQPMGGMPMPGNQLPAFPMPGQPMGGMQRQVFGAFGNNPGFGNNFGEGLDNLDNLDDDIGEDIDDNN